MSTDFNATEIYPHYDGFNHVDDDDDEINNNDQRLRYELIQKATARLRRRLLEQGLQDMMHKVVSLQTQLETLRIDAATTIDTISTIFDASNSAEEGTQRMNRQLDVLERRFETHKLGLDQLQHQPQPQQQQQQPAMLTSQAMAKTDSNLTATSVSRLSSLSLVSSIFGRSSSSAATSRATSVSGRLNESLLKQQQDLDTVSQIESIGNPEWSNGEDHPFYDLAGKRSFGAGSFCGSVYHDHHQQQQPTPCNNSASIRSRRRQRRQRLKQQMEQLQHPSEDEDSITSDDVSTFSSISGLSMARNNEMYLNHHHPLSPSTPPANCTGSFFEQIRQQQTANHKSDSMHAWLSTHHDEFENTEWDNALERNVLDDAISFLDGLTEDGSDGGFRQDVYILLENPELCCRPLAEIENKMNELRRRATKQPDFMLNNILWLLKPSALCQLAMKYASNLIYKLTCSGLQWCRFLSVLSAAVVISILKGPEDICRSAC